MIKDKLVQLGLTENEARLYEYLLENYKAKASELAKHLEVTHPAVKKMIDSLLEKELIRAQDFGKSTFYFLQESGKISEYIERMVRKSNEENQKKLELAQQTEQLIYGKSSLEKDADTNITFYKGKEGIDALVKEISNSSSKVVYEFVDFDLSLYTKTKDKANYINEYKEKGIIFKPLYTTNSNRKYESNLAQDPIQIDKDKVMSPSAHTFVFDDKIAFSFITDDRTILIIQNRWIVNTLLTLFENLREKIAEEQNNN